MTCPLHALDQARILGHWPGAYNAAVVVATTLSSTFMATREEVNHRKRLYEASSHANEEQTRSIKRRKESSSYLPPHVWNKLSKVTLTRRALQEFDRRTKDRAYPVTREALGTNRRLLRSDTRRLEQCAKKGGPDLSRLRGVSATQADVSILDLSADTRHSTLIVPPLSTR